MIFFEKKCRYVDCCPSKNFHKDGLLQFSRSMSIEHICVCVCVSSVPIWKALFQLKVFVRAARQDRPTCWLSGWRQLCLFAPLLGVFVGDWCVIWCQACGPMQDISPIIAVYSLKLERCQRRDKAWSQGRTEEVQTRIRVCETFEMRPSVQKQQIQIKLHSLPLTKCKVCDGKQHMVSSTPRHQLIHFNFAVTTLI